MSARRDPTGTGRLDIGRLVAIPVIGTLLVAAFSGSFGLYRYFDDWAFPGAAESALAGGRWARFLITPQGRHWSPLWNAFQLLNQRLAGWESDALIRSVIVVIQLAALFWLARLAMRLGLSTLAKVAALVVLGLHPDGAAALYSFDTDSQCAADLVTWLAGGLAFVALLEGKGGSDWRFWTAIGLLPIGLLFKEEALSGAACVLFLIVFSFRRPAAARERTLKAAGALLVLAEVGLFTWARWAAGVYVDADGPFRLCVSCAPVNLALLLGSFTVPVRTLVLFDAWLAVPRHVSALLTASLATLVFWIAVGIGLFRRVREAEHSERLWALAALFALSAFPVALLGRVGLLYTHTGVFWFALLVGEATDGWAIQSTPRLVTASTLVAALALTLGVGLRANLAEVRATGLRSRLWLDRYAAAIAALPPNSIVAVHANVDERPSTDFSLYRMTTPDRLILLTEDALRHRLGNRVAIVILSSDETVRSAIGDTAAGRPVYEVRRSGEELLVTLLPARMS